ncbi:MAG: DUF2652 domain-containing protein [Paracoccaceae bacterium]
MLPTPEPVTLLIADISGYTKFLAATEIAHAQDIVADFLSTVIEALAPQFRLAKYEGDAVFLAAAGAPPDSSVLEDLAEGAYFAFRRRQRDVRQATSCTCAACAAMGGLDLKIVVHTGEAIRQRLGGQEDFAGRDVILVHRLLKNRVTETFGPAAYALYTASCLVDCADPARRGLAPHEETDATLGAIPVWRRDLAAAWAAAAAGTGRFVTSAEALVTWEFALAAPPPMVWEYLTVPGLWQAWSKADEITEASDSGRRGEGSVNHCAHGGAVLVEKIISWRPCDTYTTAILLPVPDAPEIVMTRELVADGQGGTRLFFHVARPAPADEPFVRQAGAEFSATLPTSIARMEAMMREALPAA